MEKQGKKLSELRVVDLRRILEKRGLDKTGNKSILVDRLSKCLADEGHDPNFYVHSIDGDDDIANDSLLSEVGQLEENVQASESKETISDEVADDTELVDEDNGTDQPVGEDLSFQESEKMVEVDSLAEQTGTSNSLGAESTTARKDSTCVDNDANERDADTTQGVEKVSADESEVAVDRGVSNEELNDVNRLANTSEVTSTRAEQTEADTGSAVDTDGTFVVHIDESDTNLDYDLPGDKGEERDAPTPTKDESMDVDSADIVQSTESVSSRKEADKTAATTGSGQASKSSVDSRTDTPKKDSKDLSASQNLWISGLSSLTRATDLKAVFTKHGKVIGAKVVTNANRPGAKCYGYVTMSSSEEAARCIQHLHRTELHGRMISVEKAKTDPAAQARAASQRKPSNVEEKKKEEPTASNKEPSGPDGGRVSQTSHRTDDKSRHPERHRPRVAGSTAVKKEGEPAKEGEKKPEKKELSEAERKAEEYVEREKRRLRLLERRARDDDYRRRNALLKEKREISEQMRHIRMEEERLNREREKLRLEREKARIEEMKLESLQGERTRLENQLLELRQRVDREREELKRVETLRLEEMRRSASLKRSYEAAAGGRSSGGGRYDDGWDAKRPTTSDRYSSAVSVDRRGTTGSDRYSERRTGPDMDRRSAASKDVGVDRSNGRSDDRYSRSSGERREYTQGEGRSRDVSSRSVADTRGGARSYHDSSRRSGDRSDRSTWNGSTTAPGLLSGPSNELFSGAAVQAAGMMMSAAMNRGSTTSSRYAGSAPNSGYGGARRY